MPEETILRKHCRVYLKTFRAQRARHVHAYYAHRRAESEADKEFRLTAEEKRRRDEWLDGGREFEGWRVEPEPDKGRSLFDDVMRAE